MSLKSENFPGEAKKNFLEKILNVLRPRIWRRIRWRPPFCPKNSPFLFQRPAEKEEERRKKEERKPESMPF